ncbi:MAG: TatD family hydrolase [Flavobacteriales bacterium]|jgi:TatD DNase family protein|uniref:TatD family hydrolase n=1 Tax=Candidatus Ulvibacter alkanivorans TaxID=2267620 RepID=UPI000DF16A73|nr:TatD family hydrolase [Candidatus Ulvibacter alkanivorans]MCH2490328.1 TatD family hydrolase [Flavobacteriales bacterium]
MLTDTHTHLYSDAFEADRTEMIQRAMAEGVNRFFIPAIDSETTEDMYALEATFPEHMFLMMGLHPTSVKENYEAELRHVTTQLEKRTFYAIGEIGIDLYWDRSTLSIQKKALKQQIQLAKKHKLPIVIHCRDAFDEIFEVLETEKDENLFGIFHCFTGTLAQAERAISFNMKLGIGGVVTFKNGKIDTFLHQIPLKHIVLETDSPYLSPVPYRGKRNESSYLSLICKKVAEIYGVSEEEVARTTTKNSKDTFGI